MTIPRSLVERRITISIGAVCVCAGGWVSARAHVRACAHLHSSSDYQCSGLFVWMKRGVSPSLIKCAIDTFQESVKVRMTPDRIREDLMMKIHSNRVHVRNFFCEALFIRRHGIKKQKRS